MKKYITIIIIVFTSLLADMSIYAQQLPDIQLRNGVLKPGNRLSRGSFDKKRISAGLFLKNYYVLIQLDKIPDLDTRQKMEIAGIYLEEYISGYAYMASLKRDISLSSLTDYGIVSVNVLPGGLKVDHRIAYFDPLIRQNGKYFVINYFASLDRQTVEKALKEIGANIVLSKIDREGMVFIYPDKALVEKLAALPFVIGISLQEFSDKPLNYVNVSNQGISGLYHPQGKGLSGKNVTVGVGDNADISTHIDFAGRLINRTPWIPQQHGTHTSGTTAGAGILDIKNHGIAPKATIVSQYFSDIITNAPVYRTDYNMVVTNNSYYSVDNDCPGEGEYDAMSSYADRQLLGNEPLMHVVAAGNDGSLTCSPYPAFFGTVKSGWQSAKNVLTVGAVKAQDNTGAYFSSRGPLHDGRIKPEICAGGWNVLSSTPYNTYALSSGTSMATPVVTGSLALMYERYRKLHAGNDPNGSLMKAIICNTAEDLGNPGPDYTYGFGMINIRRAIDVIDSNRYLPDTISQGISHQYAITVPAGTAQMKVLLYWPDKEASLTAPGALVNDLDVSVSDPSSVVHYPLILNSTPANVNDYAFEGLDRVNNIEQVVIKNPVQGNYTIQVNGYSIPSGPQHYFITYELLKPSIVVEYPFGGETFVPGDVETIRWSTTGLDVLAKLKLEYSTDSGTTWVLIDNNIPAGSRLYNWVVPSVATGKALVRISDNNSGMSDISDYTFTIIGRPEIDISNTCPGYATISWHSIPGATGYDVMILDVDTMRIVAAVSDTSFLFSGLKTANTYWMGVRAKTGTSFGRRSLSKSVLPNGGACADANYNYDVLVDTVFEPETARQYFADAANATSAVKVRIKNLGQAAITVPFTVSYSCEGGSATETIHDQIAAGASYIYSFTTPFMGDSNGFHYHFKVWVNVANDPNHKNDTAYKNVSLLQNTPLTVLPLTEGFETTDTNTYTAPIKGLAGNDALDFCTDAVTGRARTFVNSGFSRSGNRAMTLDQSPYSENPVTDSLILTYNLQLLSARQLRLDIYYRNHGQDTGSGNKIWLRGSENDPWVQAYDLYANQAETGGWKRALININDVLQNASPSQQMTSTFQVKLGEQGNTSANTAVPDEDIDDGYTFDDLHIKEAINDIAAVKIISPDRAGCSLSAQQLIGLHLKSYNSVVLYNISVGYRINDGQVITEIIDSLNAGQSMDYYFTQRADLSTYAKYNIQAWVHYDGDDYAENDTVSYQVHSVPLVISFPYLERFENSDGGYYTEGKNTSWQWGVPLKTVIHKSANGNRAWVTNLSGHYNNNEVSYLYTPCFDLTGLVHPVLSFAHIYEVEKDYDYTWVEYTTDGANWYRLGAADGNGTNWYDNLAANNWRLSNTRWHVASREIPVTGTVVRFRFVLSSDAGVTEDGVGIDDVHIFDRQPVYSDTLSVAATGNSVAAGWYHFTNNNSRIVSIKTNEGLPGSLQVNVFPKNTYIVNGNGKYYLGKNFVIRPSCQFIDTATLRLYFTDSDANALLAAPPCDTCGLPEDAFGLGITVFSGITEDASLEDNVSGRYKVLLPADVDVVPYDNGYYAEFPVTAFSEYWLGSAETSPVSVMNCPGVPICFTAYRGADTYQWQVNTGSGFVAVPAGVNYTGVNTDSLQITGLASSASGYVYRCVVDGRPDYDRALRFTFIWSGQSDSNWLNPGNWNCGIIPDQYSDVIIPAGIPFYPNVPADVSVRSIRVENGASVNVNPGIHFRIEGE